MTYCKVIPMKKGIFIFLLVLMFSTLASAETYYFKECKLSNIATGNYIINIDKKIIEATLIASDGRVQKFIDKIKKIEKNQIVTEKIESGKGSNIYFEYYLDAKLKKITKLQYKRQKGLDIDVYKIQEKKVSECSDVKGGWNKKKIKKAETDKEQKRILKAQEKIKKEQNKLIKCLGKDYSIWTNCTGSYLDNNGHKYEGSFKSGKIIKGIAIFADGAKYVGEFKNNKPHGFGNFAWTNGDKYFGEWKDGKNHGNGTKIWKDGREYSGSFQNDKMHGTGTFYYSDGKKYVGEFMNGKRHGEGTFTYTDGTAFIGNFIDGKQQGLGECIAIDGTITPCERKIVKESKKISPKNAINISIVAKKWVRISQYENNSKKGKKVMDKLKVDFDTKAAELCIARGNYKTLDKKIEILELDETPAYGLETKVKVGITGSIECI